MFSVQTYIERRKKLKELVKSGLILFPGNNEVPMNYAANTYHFRQDSNFLYYFGLDETGLAAVIDVDSDNDIIFGDDRPVEDVVWMGPLEPLKERAKLVGVNDTSPAEKLDAAIKYAQQRGRKIHFVPPYHADVTLQIESLTGIPHSEVNKNASQDLIKAIVSQRSIKSAEEISEIEKALDVSYEMYEMAMRLTKPGMVEREISGLLEGIALLKGNGISFPMIFSVRGETLHNHYHGNIMKDGELAVLDSGVESLLHYASDITRTFPVNGKFTSLQKGIYNIVLKANTESIKMIKPGLKYKEVHLNAAKITAEGMKELGFMKGNVDDAVSAGAHALFFPHGLGHMLGLDVHDMEGLGENFVGYDDETKRSEQFGLAYLRCARELKPGFVLTVEPGIYFIPQLIDNWKAENRHAEFINYDKVETMKGFGGIRIEDDVLITETGSRVLGKPIPKTIEEVETACNK
ncbi:MAG: aminopeptidase P family protein [bacterium]